MTSPMTHHLRPKYESATPDTNVSHYLFIAEEAALPLLKPLFNDIDLTLRKSLVVTDLDISPVTTAAYELIPRSKTISYTDAFILANSKNVAVYIAGTESFLWSVHQRVLKAGIEKSKIHLLEPISDLRRIICTHCFTIMDNISDILVTCSGCQRQLEVQDQFSEMHGAYAASGIRLSNKPQKTIKTITPKKQLF
ncbi:dimethylamine monooxygenase subunit DmmA family protein [Leucothrix pacifica]|uniref:Dimethylamine monooxygenase subunit DmmA-like C-terminal domain-containing protein n=1 Tax=Leucothrix pacifica TaxID=1247513 RepID=A0A317C2H8_9GAMM|nr:dimethylamine monooxygenase subunit DmmA family protein [Leucothrix pacifica]PWQ92557.1 hypothetical protein DKW60_20435 [Leucothrix pacifica]